MFFSFFIVGQVSATDKIVINLIACTNLPFQHINHPTFKALFGLFGKRELLRDESHYRDTVLPRVYSIVRAQIRKELDECPTLSFTLDFGSFFSHSFMRYVQLWKKTRSSSISISAVLA